VTAKVFNIHRNMPQEHRIKGRVLEGERQRGAMVFAHIGACVDRDGSPQWSVGWVVHPG